MKRKLLTVLLAVVMVFGVFGLTACGGSNADADYNYYSSKYSIDVEDVKIQAVTFQAVYKMFTTDGSFLLYVDSEQGSDAATRFAAINKLANDWNVTIYHFNPDLSGGYKAEGNPSANIITAGIKGAHIKNVQDLLSAISKVEATKWTDNSLVAVSGKSSTASKTGALTYNGKIAKSASYDKAAEAIAAVATKQPSYGKYTSEEKDVPVIPEAYNTANINTMNLFGDARLHVYDDRDALTEEKTDVFVTVANYAMFADLLANNEGYFAVFFGGTWCPNTQAIVYHVNKLAKDYGIEKVYFFDPRLDDGVRLDQVSEKEDGTFEVLKNKGNVTGNLNTRNNDGEAQWAALKDAAKASNYAAQAQADIKALTVKTENEGFKPTIAAKYTAAAIKTVVDGAKAAAYTAEYAKVTAAQKAAVKAEYTKEAYEALSVEAIQALELAAAEIDVATAQNNAVVKAIADMDANDSVTEASIKANAKAAYIDSVYGYQHLYGSFLSEYLNTYWSEWNITAKLTIGGKDYTRMCVPNMMMFNGEGEGNAELVALAEAEYTWANTSVDGNPQKDNWENAVKAVFDANPYADYAPVMVVEQAAADAPAAAAPAAGAGDAGGC